MTLSNTSPAPGDIVNLDVTFCSNAYQSSRFEIAIRPTPNNTIIACPAANQTFVVWSGGSGSTSTTSPPGGGWNFASVSYTACRTISFSITIPMGLTAGVCYNMIVHGRENYIDCTQEDDRKWAAFCLAPPSSGNSTLLKRVEGTAQNGQLMLYWLDYDFYNSTGIQVRDTIPPCATILGQSPNPTNGSPATVAGQTITWNIPNADISSTPNPYRQKGSLWVEVSLAGCAGQLCNTGEYQNSATAAAWVPSNNVCQTVGQANVQLLKYQYDSAWNPTTSLPNLATVNYVLQYQFSGSGLKCFDGFQTYTVGTTYHGLGNTPAFGSWYYGPGDNGAKGWQIIPGDTPGEQIVKYYECNACAVYRTLLFDCPPAKINGEDFCTGMVEADVRIDGNFVNGDIGLVIRQNNVTTGAGEQYMVLLSVDPNPAGHIQIQKNCTAGPTWWGGVNLGANGPQFGVWYTIKALEQPMGTFYAKFWPRGTPEPTGWMTSWTDTGLGGCPMHSCTAVDGNPWRPGIAGQADYMSYDNFRVYSANSLSGAQLWDTVPLGVDYVSSSPLANGAVPTNSNVPATDMVRWDFTGNNFGAVGGILFEGTGSFTWTGITKCIEALHADNTGTLGSASPAIKNSSNTTGLDITGCSTPTNTPTRTPTKTATLTNSPTPTFTVTFTATYTASPTLTSTPTPSFTNTYTPTLTATPTLTRTPTSTYTWTPTPTPTFTPTNTFTFTATLTGTPTVTLTRSPTPTATDTITPGPTPTFTLTYTFTLTFTSTYTLTATKTITLTNTPTPTITITTPYSPTNTPTATNTFSNSPTPTPTNSFSFTYTPTPTATQTVTFTQTNTVTNTPTPSATMTDSPTRTATSTVTGTPTATPSFSFSPTATQSNTFTPTPIPVPFTLSIGAYNEAGELVKIIFSGSAQTLPNQLGIDTHQAYTTSGGSLAIGLPGYVTQKGIQTYGGVSWDLSNNNAQGVDSGVYYIKAEYRDNFGKTTALVQAVQVINTDPENSLVIYNSAGEEVKHMALGGSLTDIAIDKALTQFAPVFDADGKNSSGQLTITARSVSGSTSYLYWDGTSDMGAPVNSGTYSVQLTYRSKGGVRTVVIRSVTVIKTGDNIGFGGLRFGPNPAMGGATFIKVVYPLSAGTNCVASLYNMAGELVSSGTDPLSSGAIRIGIQGLSGGIYLMKLEKRYGVTVRARIIVKIAIAQ